MIQSPRGMTIMEAYELHRKNMLLVNRRYQRKLVWTIAEKQKLIDSILSKFLVPLILLASIEDGQYEILYPRSESLVEDSEFMKPNLRVPCRRL